MKSKYIFVTGAPGSRWSSVVHNIYYGININRSDSSEHRVYRQNNLVHSGVYFEPGNEYDLCENFNLATKKSIEEFFDSAFCGPGIKIIKSHIFSLHIDYIKATWPDCPIVCVYRTDEDCYNWWTEAGGFDITYPDYRPYYVNLEQMRRRIQQQNTGILTAWANYPGQTVDNNVELAELVGAGIVPEQYQQQYANQAITVRVLS